MFKRKISKFFIIVLILQFISSLVYADEVTKQNIIKNRYNSLGGDINTEEDIDSEEITKTSTQAQSNEELPKINSREAIVLDRKSKKIIFGKNENERVAMASTTKIMTATIIIENYNLEDEVIVSAKAAGIGGSRLGLKKNDKITVKHLLYGLMLCSGNDAAVALAEYAGGSVEGFADKMNDKANKLGLKDTHFVTPHGLDDPEHYTTAYELAILADYAMQNETFAKIVRTKNATILINGYTKNIKNTNELLGNLEGVNGIKTGFTNNAGRCLVTCTNRNDFEIITVVLGADAKKNRTEDSIKLIEYTYKNYKLIDITDTVNEKFKTWKTINENRITVEKARKDNKINLKYEKIINNIIPVKINEQEKIEIEIKCLYYLKAPIENGSIIGNMRVICNGELLEIVNIINTEKIEKKNKQDYFLEFLSSIA